MSMAVSELADHDIWRLAPDGFSCPAQEHVSNLRPRPVHYTIIACSFHPTL